MTSTQSQNAAQNAAQIPENATERVFARERRHSRYVRVLKFALPSAAVALIAGFVVYSMSSTYFGKGFELSGVSLEGGRLVMANPKLDGYTKDNRPYSMTAKRAVQGIKDAQRIDLEGIDAEIPVKAGQSAKISADTGVFHRGANKLEITSPATLQTDDGMTLYLNSATVDVRKGEMNTEDPVEIVNDGARIQADSMSVKEDGDVMVFKKRVKVRIDGNRLTTASTGGDGNAAD